MPKSKLSPMLVSQDKKTRISELVCQGKNLTEVAKIIGVTVGRVSQIMSEVRAEWTAKREVAVQDHIEIEVAYVRHIRQEALDAWEKSKQDGVTVTTVKSHRKDEDESSKRRLKKADKELEVIRQEERRTGQVGDVACLHVAENCTDKLLKLLGAFPKEDKGPAVIINQWPWQEMAVPVVNGEAIDVTPSAEVEARIEAEVKSETPPSNNGNGNGQSH